MLASHGLMSSRPFQCLPENASVQSQHLLACSTLARGWSGFRAPDLELSGIGIIHSSWTLGCQEWILGSQEWIQGSQEWILDLLDLQHSQHSQDSQSFQDSQRSQDLQDSQDSLDPPQSKIQTVFTCMPNIGNITS